MARVRRGLPRLAPAAIAALLAACAISITTSNLHDDRIDRTTRSKGTAAIIGDSIGYGLVLYGGLWDRLARDGWGPVRSISVLGMHAAPEFGRDGNTVVGWIARLRSEGIAPKVMVVVAGANDVGYPSGGDLAHDVARIQTAMTALGNMPVVWATIVHPNASLMAMWNAALANVASRRPNLHVCNWAAQAVAHPGYLAKDRIHMTLGPFGGYVAMQTYVAGCVARATVPAPPPTTTPTTRPTTTITTTTTTTATTTTTMPPTTPANLRRGSPGA
jgi:GDSL-like Lipase/Acylhydrolase family